MLIYSTLRRIYHAFLENFSWGFCSEINVKVCTKDFDMDKEKAPVSRLGDFAKSREKIGWCPISSCSVRVRFC